MDAIKTFKSKNQNKPSTELRIYQDQDPQDPRGWDNLGKMVLSHKRYSLSNEISLNFDDFGSWDLIRDHLLKDLKAEIILTVKGYDHSGLSISCSQEYPFNDYWDSGILGFIFCTKEDILKNFNAKKLNKNLLEKAKKNLIQEVKTYNQYLNGDVYGFNVIEFKTCMHCFNTEEINKDSCWGFFGGDDLIKDIFEAAGLKQKDFKEV